MRDLAGSVALDGEDTEVHALAGPVVLDEEVDYTEVQALAGPVALDGEADYTEVHALAGPVDGEADYTEVHAPAGPVGFDWEAHTLVGLDEEIGFAETSFLAGQDGLD